MADTNKNVSPAAQDLANRIDLLHQNGHGWMDPTLQVHLAQNGGSTINMLNTADVYKSVSNISGSAPTNSLVNPAGNARPSALQDVFSVLHNTHGPVPVLHSDVTTIQQGLQSKGYGTDLPVGSWNPQWQMAFNDHATAIAKQPGKGNVQSMPFWKTVLNEFMPSTWSHALVNYVHTLPQQGRQMVADAITGLDPTSWYASNSAQAQTLKAQHAAAIENALGGNVKGADLNMTARYGQDISNLMNLVLLKGVGSAAAKAAGTLGEGYASTLVAEGGLKAAMKDIPTAAKNLVTRSLPEEFAAAPKFTVVKSLYQAGIDGGKGTGVLSFLENKPFMKRMLGAIDRMDVEGSTYYKIKDALAQKARIPLVQASAIAQSKGSLGALALLGANEVENAINANPTYDSTKVKGYEGPLANAADMLSLFVGSPTRAISTSQHVGQVVKSTHDALSNALGSIGMDSIVRNGLGIPLDELKSNLGEDFVNDYYGRTKISQFAASHYATNALNAQVWAGNVERNSAQADKLFQQYEHEVLTTPKLLNEAVNSLVAQPGLLSNYFRNDSFNILSKNVRKGVEDYYNPTASDKTRYFEAMKRIRDLHEPASVILQDEHRNLFHGSATMTNIQDMITKGLADSLGSDAHKFDDTLAKSTNKSPVFYHINKNVSEFAPDANNLVRPTKYGSGVVATENTGWAGRTKSNIFNLKHNPEGGELPSFYDMSKKGASKPVADSIKGLLGGTIDAPAGFAANTTVRQFRDELGLMKAGKEPGTLVHIDKSEYPKAYQDLRKILNNNFDYNGQQVLDAYRKALVDAGKLNKDQIDERINQITSQLMADNKYTGFHFLDPEVGQLTVLNPDRVIARMAKKDPRWTVDSLIPSYLQDNNIVKRGSLGFARKDTFVAQDAQRAVGNLFNKLTQLGHGQEVDAARGLLQMEEQNGLERQVLPALTSFGSAEAEVLRQANKVLIQKLGYSANEVSRLSPIQSIAEIWRASKDLASEAYLPIDAPQAVKDAVAQVEKLGFRPVLGTDIGHSFESPIIAMPTMAQRTSIMRKAAMKWGFDITRYNDQTIAQSRRMHVENEINKLFSTGKVQPALGDTGNAVYSLLMQYARTGLGVEDKAASFLRGGIQSLKENKIFGKEMPNMDTMTLDEIKAAQHDIRQKITDTFNETHTIRDLTLKQMVKALTRPIDPKGTLGEFNNIGRYSNEDAMKIAKAVLIGYSKVPASMVGGAKVEDFLRASNAMLTNATASFFGQVPLLNKFKIGEGPLANTFADLPANLTRLRDKWRFDLNPIFSYRRVAKTNLKAAAEGIPTSRNPLAALERLGKDGEAFEILNRTMPKVYQNAKELESLDKFLLQNDVFNIYNPAHHMAWQAYHLAQQGLSDAEITKKLEKINTYGDRTPLERTVNTVFYPFSFNKTLYRSVGGYLLDHAGEAVLIAAGMNLYQHYNPNNEFGKWVDKHAPLLNELKKLNAFEHGTGLGQFGGINAPYFSEIMNLFSPQRIVPSSTTQAVSAWMNALPALAELNTILFGYNKNTGTANLQGSAIETAKVGFWALENAKQHIVDLVKGQSRLAYQPMMTDRAQIQAGIEASTMLKMQLSGIIGQPGAVWPNDPSIPANIRGQKINTTSIGEFIKNFYPAYNPNTGVGIALAKSAEAKQYVARLDGTYRYEAYKTFMDLADKTVAKLHKESDSTKISALANPLRQLAVNIAEQDSKFVQFYNRYYENSLGPIEGLSK